MGPSEHSPERKPLTNAELAEAFACSAPYVTKLVQEKAMPAFFNVEDAIAWRAIHAPPRGRRQNGKNRDEKHPPQQPGPGEAGSETKDGTGESSAANNQGGGRRGGRRDGKIINIRRFIKQTADFDGLMLKQAEAVPQIAYGLLGLAAEEGDSVEIAAQLKNWADAAKAAAAARAKFLETQEAARTLLPLDEVEDVVGTFLIEIQKGMIKLDERVASALLPHLTIEQVQLVRQACAAEVDKIFKQVELVPVQTRRELAS